MSHLQALHDAALVRALAACQREHIFNITTLEYEKQELKNFLKKLFTCASDNDPAYIKYITTGATKPQQPKRGNSQQGRRRRLLTATKVSTPKCGRRVEGQHGVTLPAVEDKQQQGVANSCPDINRLTREVDGLEIIEELPMTASTDSLVKSQQDVSRGDSLFPDIEGVVAERSNTMPAIAEAPAAAVGRVNQTPSFLTIDFNKAKSPEPKPPKQAPTTAPGTAKSVAGKPRRVRSRSKVENDEILKVRAEKQRKEKLRLLQLNDKVRTFCKRLDELKMEMAMQGMLTQFSGV